MGDKVTGNITDDSGKTDKRVGAGAGAGASTKGATTSAGSDNGTGAGAGAGARTGAGARAEEKEPVKVAILTDEEQKKKDEKNAKRREAYAKKKAEGEKAKPKKVNKAKKDEPVPLDPESLKALFVTVSTLVASRPGNEHWLLSEKEVDSIITPLNKMLADSKLFEGAGAYSNQIALIVACVTIFVPRIFISINKANEKKKREVTGNVTDTTVKPGGNTGKTKNETVKPAGGNNRPVTASGKNNGNNVPFYGSPIA